MPNLYPRWLCNSQCCMTDHWSARPSDEPGHNRYLPTHVSFRSPRRVLACKIYYIIYTWSLYACHVFENELHALAVHGQWHIPANTRTWPNSVSILDQRRRRWANIETALGQVLVFADIGLFFYFSLRPTFRSMHLTKENYLIITFDALKIHSGNLIN